MAILSALLSLLLKKIGSLVQALFGWSVMALFGKLTRTKQIMVSVTLVLAAIWPVMLVGTVFPGVAAWALAFLPLHRWLGETVLRALWIGLALMIPPVVGWLTRLAAGARSRRGGVIRALLAGFPLTLGYFCAFFITLITVPAAKLGAMARRWSDDHVYVQAKAGNYRATLHAIAEAFALAGLVPEVEAVPTRMSLASKALKWLARSALEPIIPDEPERLVADGIEAYLYPADLMLRGEPHKLSRVRAMLSRTDIDRAAYLVSTPRAQDIQDEIARLWDMLKRHEHPSELSSMGKGRLGEVYRELNTSDIEYDEWVMLERLARRFERALTGGPTLLDNERDGLEQAQRAAEKIEATSRAMERNSANELA